MGNDVDNNLACKIAGKGIIQVFEGRRVLEHLSVDENIRAGHIGEKSKMEKNSKMVQELFPHLKGLRKKAAGWLSGGEQQMPVIGRALSALSVSFEDVEAGFFICLGGQRWILN